MCRACDWFCDKDSWVQSAITSMGNVALEGSRLLGFDVPDPTFSHLADADVDAGIPGCHHIIHLHLFPLPSSAVA
jgi:hypothetical protein